MTPAAVFRMNTMSPPQMKTAILTARAFHAVVGLGAALGVTAAAVAAVNGSKKIPSLEDVAPGMGRVGEQVPAIYMMAVCFLVGLSILVVLVVHIVRLVVKIVETHNTSIAGLNKSHAEQINEINEKHDASIASLADRYEERVKEMGSDCHAHSLAMMQELRAGRQTA